MINFLSIRMTISSSSNMAESSFGDAVAYGFSALTSSCLTLKEEQLLFVKAVYKGKDVFVWVPIGFGKRLLYQILPFVLVNMLGLTGPGKSSAVLVVSPLVSLVVNQV